MRKFIGWFFTPAFLLLFGGILVTFHPILVVARQFGYQPHKVVLDLMCWCIYNNLQTAGVRIAVSGQENIPSSGPIIVVSNHQSMFDIPLIIWKFRRLHPKFISKKELGRGIPSISYSLRQPGFILIDRKNPAQAIPAIRSFGAFIEEHKYAACIFPEGTRARDGKMKPFKNAGLLALLQTMPSAVIVPVAITGAWEILKYRFRPVPFGVRFSMHILPQFNSAASKPEETVKAVETIIRSAVESHQNPKNLTTSS